MDTIYKKTTTGQEEITSRAHGLSSRLRRCLILIDGKRDLTELKTLLSTDDVEALLSELSIEGYVEIAVHGTPNASTQSALNNSTSNLMPAKRPLSLAERKQRAAHILQDELGPMAEDIAIQIEQAQDQDTLTRQLEKGYAFLKELRNKSIADKYRVDVRLP